MDLGNGLRLRWTGERTGWLAPCCLCFPVGTSQVAGQWWPGLTVPFPHPNTPSPSLPMPRQAVTVYFILGGLYSLPGRQAVTCAPALPITGQWDSLPAGWEDRDRDSVVTDIYPVPATTGELLSTPYPPPTACVFGLVRLGTEHLGSRCCSLGLAPLPPPPGLTYAWVRLPSPFPLGQGRQAYPGTGTSTTTTPHHPHLPTDPFYLPHLQGGFPCRRWDYPLPATTISSLPPTTTTTPALSPPHLPLLPLPPSLPPVFACLCVYNYSSPHPLPTPHLPPVVPHLPFRCPWVGLGPSPFPLPPFSHFPPV